ncbi:hypothetical protein BT96DRAFT_934553 [Gymnopus androsaceus JB14]|uniref:Uncharacterized protein n=1 Tax=Gymnopus androsaceus JB14 TaxID=1447944 RepID=A0A6A4I7F6_9AGAR|nr:hypothetical protein BT96DRAFT_934553 [Gymnopus androsaceus JB14]
MVTDNRTPDKQREATMAGFYVATSPTATSCIRYVFALLDSKRGRVHVSKAKQETAKQIQRVTTARIPQHTVRRTTFILALQWKKGAIRAPRRKATCTIPTSLESLKQQAIPSDDMKLQPVKRVRNEPCATTQKADK